MWLAVFLVRVLRSYPLRIPFRNSLNQLIQIPDDNWPERLFDEILCYRLVGRLLFPTLVAIIPMVVVEVLLDRFLGREREGLPILVGLKYLGEGTGL